MKIVKTGYYGLDELDGKDSRSEDWKKQRKERGFDSSELWSLGDTIVKFSLPRIKEMQRIESEVNADYNALIEGLEIFIRSNGNRIFTNKEEKKVQKALDLFGKMLPGMWY